MSDIVKSDEELKATDQKWAFESLSKWHMLGRGDVYTVRSPIKCYGFDWLLGKTATIDGKEWKIVGVERFAKAQPTNKGEMIGLLVNSMNYGDKA